MKDVTDTDAREDARTGTGPDRWPTAAEDGRNGAHDGTAHDAAGLRDAHEPGTPGTGTDAASLGRTAPGTDGTHAAHGTHGTHGGHETHASHGTHGVHGTDGTGTHGSHEPGTPGTGTDAASLGRTAPGTDGTHAAHGTHGTHGGHETHTSHGTHVAHGAHEPGKHGATGAGATHAALLPDGERDRLELRVRDAVTHFVDRPRAAVEEADGAVEDLLGRLTEALAERRSTLRRSWQDSDGTADTEQLRLALRDYRELAERLLHV
ncbi:hypothetical protein [Streptomyces viridochromogenes]|uniref:hypothetical protein n=1 Tax=Streptomyces viridochromogenes TaxID=1938 RepID=UPI0031E39B88